MATPHIESRKEDIAPVVIMPGDPLRAKFIAKHFLEDVKQINAVRNMFAYTGFYKGKKITVFASGMGMSSVSIYAYELFQYFGVDTIIRVGSVGAYQEEFSLFDLILVDQSFTESNFSNQFDGQTIEIIEADPEVNAKIKKMAEELNQPITSGTIHCSELFYSNLEKKDPRIDKYHCLGVEMESFALFYLAKRLKKKAATILTVSDSFVSKEKITSEEREKSFENMILLALETVSNKF